MCYIPAIVVIILDNLNITFIFNAQITLYQLIEGYLCQWFPPPIVYVASIY